MADDTAQLKPKSRDGQEIEIEIDPDLREVLDARLALESMVPISSLSGDDWEPPFDLRVSRPRAVDLRKLWKLTDVAEPPGLAASLGPNVPILLCHVVTPFPVDGHSPGGVWGLGYEFEMHGVDANTVSVMPADEVFEIGKIGQVVNFGIDIGGKIGIPDGRLAAAAKAPAVSLTNATLRASTSQSFQFSLEMRITLRKVVGAPVGIGGALWKLYRQNEPIDQPHTLMQTVLVAEGTNAIPCKIKTWAKQAGRFGMRWGARFWPYDDQEYEISLAGL